MLCRVAIGVFDTAGRSIRRLPDTGHSRSTADGRKRPKGCASQPMLCRLRKRRTTPAAKRPSNPTPPAMT